MKRFFDFASASVGLAVLSPLLGLTALAILATTGRPIIYRQVRIGRSFRPFTLYKLRTMDVTAEESGITAQDDPRITPIGRILRSTKLDETPQLFNVIRGDMSLVGPRPEIPKYVELFRQEYSVILSVRPGLTDPASIKYRRESSLFPIGVDTDRYYREAILPDKISMALDYVANQSFSGDLRIFAQTIAATVFR